LGLGRILGGKTSPSHLGAAQRKDATKKSREKRPRAGYERKKRKRPPEKGGGQERVAAIQSMDTRASKGKKREKPRRGDNPMPRRQKIFPEGGKKIPDTRVWARSLGQASLEERDWGGSWS